MSPLECTKTLAHSCILALEVSQSWYTGHTWGERVKQWRQLKKNTCLTPTQHGSTPPMKHTKREIIENVSAMCFHLCSDGSQVTKFTVFFFPPSHKLRYSKQNFTLLWLNSSRPVFVFCKKPCSPAEKRQSIRCFKIWLSGKQCCSCVPSNYDDLYILTRDTVAQTSKDGATSKHKGVCAQRIACCSILRNVPTPPS